MCWYLHQFMVSTLVDTGMAMDGSIDYVQYMISQACCVLLLCILFGSTSDETFMVVVGLYSPIV